MARRAKVEEGGAGEDTLPGVKHRRCQRTEAWHEIQQLVLWPGQRRYEEIRSPTSASTRRRSMIDSTLSCSWRPASPCPASCLSKACWNSPSKIAYAALEDTASGVPASSAYWLTMRHIIRWRL